MELFKTVFQENIKNEWTFKVLIKIFVQDILRENHFLNKNKSDISINVVDFNAIIAKSTFEKYFKIKFKYFKNSHLNVFSIEYSNVKINAL